VLGPVTILYVPTDLLTGTEPRLDLDPWSCGSGG
jgi:hypothetical protein